MTDLDAMGQMQRLSFADIEIPYQSIRIEGAGDDHEHKYPHIAGAANEKLGRRLYHITVKASLQNCFTPANLADVYPGRLQILLFHFERQDTAELRLPHRAPMQAYCTNWTADLDARMRSGEVVELKFKEDLNEEIANAQGVQIQRQALSAQREVLRGVNDEWKESIFDLVTNKINDVLAIIDRGDLYGNLLAAKVEDLIRLIGTIDETLNRLNDPLNHLAMDALHRLWELLLDIKEDIFDGGSGLRNWTTPMQLTITDLPLVLPDCASTAEELIGLNYFADPLAIPAGTTVYYYGEQ